eukprot:SAG31_NODE_263_length_18841_cov_17.270996_10_plen_203_part_00
MPPCAATPSRSVQPMPARAPRPPALLWAVFAAVAACGRPCSATGSGTGATGLQPDGTYVDPETGIHFDTQDSLLYLQHKMREQMDEQRQIQREQSLMVSGLTPLLQWVNSRTAISGCSLDQYTGLLWMCQVLELEHANTAEIQSSNAQHLDSAAANNGATAGADAAGAHEISAAEVIPMNPNSSQFIPIHPNSSQFIPIHPN